MQEQKARPPYVTFEQRSVVDVDASAEAGRTVYKNVDYAIITPVGGKDTVERDVEGWLEYTRRQVENNRLPGEWLGHYKAIYQAWKEGQDAPVNGLSVKMWPVATAADVSNLISANILTVEDLAAANEAALNRLGMGARALKQKAEAYLASADKGKLAESQAKLVAELEAAKLRIEALERENKMLLNLNQEAQAA